MAGAQRLVRAEWQTAFKALALMMMLYMVSFFSSMAGMEIFGWTSATLVLILIATRQVKWPPMLLGDWVLLGLIGVVIWGALVNTPGPKDVVEIVGGMRFVPLYFLLRAGLYSLWGERVPKVAVIVSCLFGVLAIYASSQYFTGLDVLRGDSHRAVQVLSYLDGVPYRFRSSGLLSSPMTYAYSAGIFFCLPFAFAMIPGAVKSLWVRCLMGLCALSVFVSIVTTMTRGAWLALVCALAVMALYLGRRNLLAMTGVLLVLIGLAWQNASLRGRMTSIFSAQTQSFSDRAIIWRANFAIFRDYPLFGIGYNENERLIGGYYHKLGLQGQVGHAHNTYIQFLSSTGIVGFCLYMAFALFYFYLSHTVWRSLNIEIEVSAESKPWLRALVLAAIGGQIVLHVGGLTECNFKNTAVKHEFMFMLAFVAIIYYQIKQARTV